MGNKHSLKDDETAASPAVSRNGSRKSCPLPVVTDENFSVTCAQFQNQPLSSTTIPEQRHKYSFDDPSAQPIQLTPYQKAILREAWQRISKKGTGNIGSLIFRRMMAKNTDIKRLFQHITGVEGVFGFGLTPIKVYRHHSVLFVKVLDEAIASLDDLRPFVLECIEYGEKHSPYRKYGFSPDMWDVFGHCMTEAAREWEGWKKHRETLRAWTILISFIVDRMRQGYENAVRKEVFMEKLASSKHSASVDECLDAADIHINEKYASGKGKANATSSDSFLLVRQSTIHATTPKTTPNSRRQSNWIAGKTAVMKRSKSALDIHLEQVNDDSTGL